MAGGIKSPAPEKTGFERSERTQLSRSSVRGFLVKSNDAYILRNVGPVDAVGTWQPLNSPRQEDSHESRQRNSEMMPGTSESGADNAWSQSCFIRSSAKSEVVAIVCR